MNAIQTAISSVMATARATGLFSSVATFQRPSGVFTGGGAPDGLYVNVAGLDAVACMKAMNGDPSAMVKASTRRTVPTREASGVWHILLDNLYPAVEKGWRGEDDANPGPWRVLVTDVDGTVKAYDIRGVERDSQAQMNRVEGYLVTI